MALLFMESFDGYGGNGAYATLWASLSPLATTAPVPRTGTHRISTVTSSIRVINPGSQTVIIGCAVYMAGSDKQFVTLYADAAQLFPQCTMEIGTDGKLLIRNGSNTGSTLDTSTTAPVVTGSWNFIEWKVTVGNAGNWDAKVNGVSVLSGSGDTQAATTSTIACISIRPGNLNGVDDLYLLDTTGSYLNDFIGDCRVECLSPQAGNGANVGLTPSTGTDHGALVDELPPNDDTDYNYGSTAGIKDTYAFTNVLASSTIVKAVQVTARARKTDTPTKTVALVARVGTTDTDGTTKAVASATYGQYQQIWEKRPTDNADWTVADLNGAEFGLKVVS